MAYLLAGEVPRNDKVSCKPFGVLRASVHSLLLQPF